MPKARTRFVCQSCGHSQPRWEGRCPGCGEWNTFVENIVDTKRKSRGRTQSTQGQVPRLREISPDGFARIRVPLEEFNRVMGGGIIPGSVTLVAGDPGIGKSTLLLQISGLLAENSDPVLYVSGEESAQQIKMRAERLGIEGTNLYVLAETNLDSILEHLEQLKPRMAVIDSIQAVHLDGLTSSAGSISQVRECAATTLRLAKSIQVPVFIVGHVTKKGSIAGPRVLEHIVDTVLYLEGERFHSYRLLRGVKNRFGSTNEVGVFEMCETGLREISNPSQVFLAGRETDAPGSAIAVTLEGTRPILVEIQALTSRTSFGLPRRTANGVDFNRLLLLVAVLSKRVGMGLSNQDVFANVVGGLRVNEPAADLALTVAIASSYRNRPVAPDLALVGEIGLSGELRAVGQIEKRLMEASKLGFGRCLLPRDVGHRRLPRVEGIQLVPVRSVAEALDVALVK